MLAHWFIIGVLCSPLRLHLRPASKKKRLADFARVARFWADLGLVRLHESDFYTYAPELIDQHGPASDMASEVVNRVAHGRRRRQFR